MKKILIYIAEAKKHSAATLESGLAPYCRINWLPDTESLNLQMRRAKADLVILDLNTLSTPAPQFVVRFRLEFPSSPLVLLSDQSSEELILSLFRAGASDFFKKPIDAEQVRKTIMELLELNKANKRSKSPGLGGFWDSIFPRLRQSRQDTRANFTNRRPLYHPTFGTGNEAQKDSAEHKPASQIHPQKLRIQFLGAFRVYVGDIEIVDWPSRKGKEIFAYLSYNHKRRLTKDTLMSHFWPASTPESARNCLNVALHGIRQAFAAVDPEREYIQFKYDAYFINPEIEVELDVEQMRHYWQIAQVTERQEGPETALGEYELAMSFYHGDFLEEEPYIEWTDLERENLKEIYLVILDRLSAHYGSNGKPNRAMALCELILEKDNCREEVHRRLMKCYYRTDKRDRAVRQFHKCKDTLRRELEVEPGRSTVELYQKIKNGEHIDFKKS